MMRFAADPSRQRNLYVEETDKNIDHARAIASQIRAVLAELPLRKEDLELLALDIDLNAQGIAVAAERKRKAS